MFQGAVVEFDKVELKMSRKHQLYCQYLVASSVSIVTFTFQRYFLIEVKRQIIINCLYYQILIP